MCQIQIVGSQNEAILFPTDEYILVLFSMLRYIPFTASQARMTQREEEGWDCCLHFHIWLGRHLELWQHNRTHTKKRICKLIQKCLRCILLHLSCTNKLAIEVIEGSSTLWIVDTFLALREIFVFDVHYLLG